MADEPEKKELTPIQKCCMHIGSTPDGQDLMLYLQAVVDECLPDGSESGALQAHGGRRNFALKLLRLLEGPNTDGPKRARIAYLAGNTSQPEHVRARGSRRRGLPGSAGDSA